jgi:hypothetical protein
MKSTVNLVRNETVQVIVRLKEILHIDFDKNVVENCRA